MGKSLDDVWDMLHQIDKKLDVHIATYSLRITELETNLATRKTKQWQVQLALYAALFAAPAAVLAMFVK